MLTNDSLVGERIESGSCDRVLVKLEKMTQETSCGGEKIIYLYICNFHVLSHLLLIYVCKLHWWRCVYEREGVYLCQGSDRDNCRQRDLQRRPSSFLRFVQTQVLSVESHILLGPMPSRGGDGDRALPLLWAGFILLGPPTRATIKKVLVTLRNWL